MANRTFQSETFTLVKRHVELFCTFRVGANPAVNVPLQQWNYPVLGTGAVARTFTDAAASPTFPTGSAYPLNNAGGAEGVRQVTRLAGGGNVGTIRIKLQNNYQRVLGVEWRVENATATSTIVACAKWDTTMDSANGSVIVLVFSSSAGVPADFQTGDLVHLKLILADSTTP